MPKDGNWGEGDMELEPMIGVHEVAALTGYKVPTIRTYCARNQMPHYQAKPFAELRFRVSEIKAWMRGEWRAEP